MALQLDLDEGENVLAYPFWLEDGRITADDSPLFELTHATRAGRGRQAYAPREVDVAQPAVLLQELQDADVRTVHHYFGGYH
jgi:hypothetical protein